MGKSVAQFSPAKLNLFLAITDRREDGFHNLVSVAAPLSWGDTLHAELSDATRLTCDNPEVPCDETNLVLKAVAAFREATGWGGDVKLYLEKRIPMGAGLGGGSSNAVATLRTLNTLTGDLLPIAAMRQIAAGLGADCALFVEDAPVIMRGRGECVEVLDESGCSRLRGRRVLVFKPAFGISTPWAYGQMIAHPEHYCRADDAEAHLKRWRETVQAPLSDLLANNMQAIAFLKYPALPAMHGMLREEFGLNPVMSGSGSASFALLKEDVETGAIEARIREMWGAGAFMTTAILA